MMKNKWKVEGGARSRKWRNYMKTPRGGRAMKR
jgi:hypothetical protein